MARKIIAILALSAFLIFDFACTRYTARTEPLEKARGGNPEVLGVLKKSGEYLEFSEGRPGRIMGDKVVGGEAYTNIQIARSDIKQVINERGRITEIEKNDGTRINVIRVVREGSDAMSIQTNLRATSIPMSEVDMLIVKRADTGKTIFATVGLVALIVVVGAAVYAVLAAVALVGITRAIFRSS